MPTTTLPLPILVTGSLGQIGQDLVAALTHRYGKAAIVQTDLRLPSEMPAQFEQLDVRDMDRLAAIVHQYGIKSIFHLAAILSAKGEQQPTLAWDINMKGLLNVLEVSRKQGVERVFWPSSIAVFGPQAIKEGTPQDSLTDPTTIYGISKVAGEHWCAYYHRQYGLDVRSLRYPGLISYTGQPGGGTTDYAVEIFHAAIKQLPFTSFLGPETRLPMMYMPDAIRATIEVMEADPNQIRVRTAYNLQGMSFTPRELFAEIQQNNPSFQIAYRPDFRQAIADSWPAEVDDAMAKQDWNWKPAYDLKRMTQDMQQRLAALHMVKA